MIFSSIHQTLEMIKLTNNLGRLTIQGHNKKPANHNFTILILGILQDIHMDLDHLNSLPLLEISALFDSDIQKTIQCQRKLLHRFYTIKQTSLTTA